MVSHESFVERFDSAFRSRARKALRGERADLPFAKARRLADAGSGELAEFRAGVVAPPSPNSDLEPWLVEGVLYRNPKGPPLVGDVRVRHFPLDKRTQRAEVTGHVFRKLPLGTIRDEALATLEANWLVSEELKRLGHNVAADEARRVAEEAQRRRPGRPGHPEEHYQQIAQRYLELIEEGRRDVLVALAAEWSELKGRQIPRETIRDWVSKATERKYLAPGKPGRAEARPGPKLKRTGK